MKTWWHQVKKWKGLFIPFAFFFALAGLGYILLRLNIVHGSILDAQTPIFWGIVFVTFILFGILWLLLAPDTHRLFLLFGLSVTTVGLYAVMLQPIILYVLVGMMLIILSGFHGLRPYRLIFLILYPLYYVIGCFFFGYFEVGCFLIHALGFGLAVLGLYLPHKKINYALAGGTLIVPSLVFMLFSSLYLSDLVSSEPAIRGELSSPFEDHLLYEQQTVYNFIDTNYELRIYRPLSLGFYEQIGVHSSEAYLPELTLSDFEWETVDADTYRLNFYYFEGEMQYSLLIDL